MQRQSILIQDNTEIFCRSRSQYFFSPKTIKQDFVYCCLFEHCVLLLYATHYKARGVDKSFQTTDSKWSQKIYALEKTTYIY